MDSITDRRIVVDGITYDVFVVPDEDARITDYDPEVYDDADRAAYRDTWEYVGVIVRPVFDGDPVEAAEISLWAVEYGTSPGFSQDQDMEYYLSSHPVPDMITEVRGRLAGIAEQITRALAGK